MHDVNPPPLSSGPYRPIPAPAVLTERARLAFRRRELIAIAALVALVHVALLDADGLATGGFGLASMLISAPAAMLLGARRWRGSRRLAFIGAGLVLVAARSALLPTPLTTLAGVALVLAFAVALRSPRATVPRVVRSIGRTARALPARLAAALAGTRREGRGLPLAHGSVLAIVVPALLTLGFLGVFALANAVVAEGLSRAFDAIGGSLGRPTFTHALVWSLAAIAGVALVRPAISLAARPGRWDAAGEPTAMRVAIARNSMIGVNGLFLAYNALETAHLYVGRPPEGMSTQVYAHHGVAWLTVALVLLTVVVAVLFRGPLVTHPAGRGARALAMLWIAQGLLVAVGAGWRIGLHVADSGLSTMRIVGILGTALVVIGVVLVGRAVRRARTASWLVTRQLDAFLVVVVLFAVAPTQWLSAQVNVWAIERGAIAPLLHMRAQSRDAESAAALLPLLDHPSPVVRQGVGAMLDRERLRLHEELLRRRSWRERDLLTAAARRALVEAEDRITLARGRSDPFDAMRALEDVAYDR